MRIRLLLGLTIVVLAALLAPALAAAAPPPNDNRANARNVSLPSTVNGTTVGATREQGEPSSFCTDEDGSVWYRIRTNRDGRVIVSLQAAGSLDAVVDVYRVRRSQLDQETCDTTDDNGRSRFDFDVGANQTYLIRVSRLANSSADRFQLQLQFGRPPASPPGKPLPRRGASGTLDRVTIPSVAYSMRLRAGTTYRFNLASDACTPLSLYPPGTDDFQEEPPVASKRCGGYISFTPDLGEGGRYSLLAEASGRRGPVHYRLLGRRAGRDDTAPGIFIRNHARVSGSLNARGIDVLDLYRFDVTDRSRLRLRLSGNPDFDVRLIGPRGKRLAISSDEISTTLKRGRYFAVVRAHRGAKGRYRLRRVSRTITHLHVAANGRHRARVRPGSRVKLSARVRPGVPGRVIFRIQRFDPVFGWQFYRAYRTRSARGSGRAVVSFRPPSVGRWRVFAQFPGTFSAAESESRFAFFRVERPLQE